MDLTQGAIEAIQAPVREAEKLTKAATFVDVPGDMRRKMLVQAGEHEFVQIPPLPRSHRVCTLQDLLQYADDAEANDRPMVLWHNEERVVLVLDDKDRLDTVTLDLQKSTPWEVLERMEREPSAFDQKYFIRLLRTTFKVSEAVLGEFRKLDFRTMTASGGTVTKGKESLGRSIEAEVQTGTGDLREEIILEVPIYTNPLEDGTYRIKLLLDYDAQAAKILVALEADALGRCVLAHQADIDARCRSGEAEVPIYFGAP